MLGFPTKTLPVVAESKPAPFENRKGWITDTSLSLIEITGRQNFGEPQVSTISNRGLFAPVSNWIGNLLLVFLHLLR